MAEQELTWDPAALARLQKIPIFVRGMAKKKIEKAAREAGLSQVTAEFMDASRARLMGS